MFLRVFLSQRNIQMVVDDDEMWQHDMYQVQHTRQAPVRGEAIETGTKLLISNLHFNVSDDDVKVRDRQALGLQNSDALAQ